MTNPLVYVPLLTTNPVGWAILGTAGYLAYKAGKKSGAKDDTNVEKESMVDCTIKGAMKTAYKAKMKVDGSFDKTKEKYSEMWNDARTDVENSAS
ncbi:MAG: hypothetical protein COA36_09660 [Desulfotalea sp.]|nr:MAG: hypothetical protein COA36_09660 [Desulfotalea sp.]